MHLVGGVSVKDSTTRPVCVDADGVTRTGTVSVVEPTMSVMRSAGRLVVDPRLHAGEIARFTSHVVCGPTASDCNIWTGAIGADGYGRNRAELPSRALSAKWRKALTDAAGSVGILATRAQSEDPGVWTVWRHVRAMG